MKKRWTMRRALLVLCIASVVFALLLQTFLFHQSLRRQIRAESISDHEISLNKMQTDLSNFIHTIRGEMLTIYSEQDLIAAMREAAEKDTDMKDYYWRSCILQGSVLQRRISLLPCIFMIQRII